MATHVTLKTVNDELERRGHTARLAKASNYFYFQSGEADDWLDRTVQVATIGSFTLEQWIAEFDRLADVNARLLGPPKAAKKRASKRT